MNILFAFEVTAAIFLENISARHGTISRFWRILSTLSS
jgi:hypothetical protein